MASKKPEKQPPLPDEDGQHVDIQPTQLPLPPDGGYGWVVTFASFMVNVLVDGVCFSFGIFYLAFLENFGESKSKTAWIGSALNGMYLSMGEFSRIRTALHKIFRCISIFNYSKLGNPFHHFVLFISLSTLQSLSMSDTISVNLTALQDRSSAPLPTNLDVDR